MFHGNNERVRARSVEMTTRFLDGVLDHFRTAIAAIIA